MILQKSDYQNFLPVRKENSHKGTYGRLLIIAGSKGMSGAAYLNSMAAYLSGSGLVKIYTHEDNRIILQELVPEAIMSTYTTFDEEQLKENLAWASCLLIGSGLGKSDIAEKVLKYTLIHTSVPTVIDADGINLLQGQEKLLESCKNKELIFTPHLLEMSRLTGFPLEEIIKKEKEIGNRFVKDTNFVLVLKNYETYIFANQKEEIQNQTGNNCMAKAGSGDVLAGIIAGLLAQKKNTFQSAVLGVYLHGLCGDLARKDLGVYSVLARDLLKYINRSFKELLTDE